MFKNFYLRQAVKEDMQFIWSLFEQGIAKRKEEGSLQWQDGYPNRESVQRDMDKGCGYVCLDQNDEVFGYIALIFEIEPAYEALEGIWLTHDTYAVIHRLVVSQEKKIKGLASWMMSRMESIAMDNQIFSIRADTNYDNIGMLRVFEKLGYKYCGIVYFRGGARQAYEKLLI